MANDTTDFEFDNDIQIEGDSIRYSGSNDSLNNMLTAGEGGSIHTPERIQHPYQRIRRDVSSEQKYASLTAGLRAAQARNKEAKTARMKPTLDCVISGITHVNLKSVPRAAVTYSLASTLLLCSSSGFSADKQRDDVTILPKITACGDENNCTVSGLPLPTILTVANWPRDNELKVGMESYDLTICLDAMTSAGRIQQILCESSKETFTTPSTDGHIFFTLGEKYKKEATVYSGEYTLHVDGKVRFEDQQEHNVNERSNAFSINGVSALSSNVPQDTGSLASLSERIRWGRYIPNKKLPISSNAILSFPEGYAVKFLTSDIFKDPDTTEQGTAKEEAIFLVHGIAKDGKLVYTPSVVTPLAFDKAYRLAQSPEQETIETVAGTALFANRTFATYAQEGTMYVVLVQYIENETAQGIGQLGYDEFIDTIRHTVSLPFSVGGKRADTPLAYVSGVGTGVALAWLLQPKDEHNIEQEPIEIRECPPGSKTTDIALLLKYSIFAPFVSLRIPLGKNIEQTEEDTGSIADPILPTITEIPFIPPPQAVTITEIPLRAVIGSPVYPIPELEIYGDHGRFYGPKHDRNGVFIGTYISGAPHEAEEKLLVSEDLSTITYSLEGLVSDQHLIAPLLSEQFVAYIEGYDATGKVYESVVRLDERGNASLPDVFREKWFNHSLNGYQITVGSYFITASAKIGLLASASTTVGKNVSIPDEYKGKDTHFLNADNLMSIKARPIPSSLSGENQ